MKQYVIVDGKTDVFFCVINAESLSEAKRVCSELYKHESIALRDINGNLIARKRFCEWQ